jgi:hypothetical protein
VTQTIAGITPIKASERAKWVKALLYGDTGVGKTYTAATASRVKDMSPVLFIDVEGGTKTLETYFPEVEFIRVKDTYDNQGRLVRSAWQHLDMVCEDLKTGDHPYVTYVVDSLSEAYELAMAHWMRIAVSKDKDKDPDIPGGDKKGEDSFGRDWTKARSMLRRMVRSFRDLDAHVIFTAHAQEVKAVDGDYMKVFPAFPGKLAREVSGFIDEVLYLYAKPTGKKDTDGNLIIERSVLAQPTPRFNVKSRGGLPNVLRAPDMGKICEIVLNGVRP